MARPTERDTRGIVDPRAGFERFTLTRHEPSPDLAWAVDRYWSVRWDLRDGDSYEQRVILHPAVHLVFEVGAATVEAISPHDFARRLERRGQAFGVKFRPAGFRPFLGGAVSAIAGRRFVASVVFGAEVDEISRILGVTDDVNALTDVVETFLRRLDTQPLPMTATMNAVVDLIVADKSLTRVGDLARRLGINPRRLQRLFADHVGLGPKWVINRCRIHEAADVAIRGASIDWARLAAELGYSDQSHLVRDFTATVGTSPDQYNRQAARPRWR
ncbi:AraC-like DNA-binding protein [Streptosporangium album]|uniref:AraC-like DNA-binding protein n=1 Tax=Streptosporangium album TaxID=47479 RepID=A0A7W7S351_9ACTN|nr:helix-turn-helix domain-containing protein [Streptosporangium album]MBB4942592.1 AraC-like DNA-binding protein [Streptosporangium album]